MRQGAGLACMAVNRHPLHAFIYAPHPSPLSNARPLPPPSPRCCVQAGALASFLRELLLSNCVRPDLVQADFQAVAQMHFTLMPQLVPLTPGAPTQAPPATAAVDAR